MIMYFSDLRSKFLKTVVKPSEYFVVRSDREISVSPR